MGCTPKYPCQCLRVLTAKLETAASAPYGVAFYHGLVRIQVTLHPMVLLIITPLPRHLVCITQISPANFRTRLDPPDLPGRWISQTGIIGSSFSCATSGSLLASDPSAASSAPEAKPNPKESFPAGFDFHWSKTSKVKHWGGWF